MCMKIFFKVYFFLFASFIQAQDFQTVLAADSFTYTDSSQRPTPPIKSTPTFEKKADAYGILHKTFTNIKEAQQGYYVVSGIYSKSKNLPSEVKKLNKKGFQSGYFKNPETQLYYIYLNHYENWQQALDDCETKFDNRYEQDVWVLKIDNGTLAKADPPIAEVTHAVLQEIDSVDVPVLNTAVKVNSKTSKPHNLIIERANEYFNKMWYAEAAKLYDLALSQMDQDYSMKVLQQAGDAHYFNSNMEKAYTWYHILYERYKSEMSTPNLYKYVQALKGTGNYTRSKRLMSLYNRKLAEEVMATNYGSHASILDGLTQKKDKFAIENLKINTPYSDFSPMYYQPDELVFASARDSSVFHTRRYKWNNQPYLDLYVAKINEGSQELKNALKFSKKINSKYHEASVTFSPDKETLYFTRNNYNKKLKRDKNGINHLKIYRSKKVAGEWTAAEEVSFNSDSYSTGHPALSKDGKQLYFVSDMPGSIGETDIFVVDVLENGSFSTPRNLGPEINTAHKEMFPFISDKKLYFSSNGHVGLGGLDIFSVAFDDENGFLEVQNLGKPVNSKKDDFSYIVDEEIQEGYFASNRAGGKGDDDIYSFKKLPSEEIPATKNAIAGIVTERISGALMPSAFVELLDENNRKLKEMETDANGHFIFEDLDSNTRYVLKTSKNSYSEDTLVTTTNSNEKVNVAMSLRKLDEMIKVENGIRKLKTDMIHFNFDQYTIHNDAANELDKLVAVMKDSPSMVIKIESHTDSRGSAGYNKYLSDKRAKSTRDYLISQGIEPKQIQSAMGYGEEQLLNECDGTIRCSEEQHYLNRRSEFIIVDL